MEDKAPKICLLGASFGTRNMGVNALTVGTIKAVLAHWPNAEVFLLDYGLTSKTYIVEIGGKNVSVKLENIRFSKKVYLRNNVALLLLLSLVARTVPSLRLKKALISGNHWLKQLSETDVVTALSGGDSFSDIYGIGRLLYVALPQLLALAMGRRLILLPQTIGPFEGRFAKMLAGFILRNADVVYSRDFDGLDEARTILGDSQIGKEKVRVCYDVGFVLDPVKPTVTALPLNNQDQERMPVIGLNVSGLLYMGGYSRNNMFGLKIDYPAFIADLVDFLITQKSATVVLVPHVFGCGGESDSVVCEEVYASQKARYGERLLVANGEYNQSEIKYIIGLCDFFVGSRMHACIAAVSQNIPTVSIAYSKKFAGVMKSIGIGELVADPRNLNREQILALIGDAFERRAALREHLEMTMPAVREGVLRLFSGIECLRAGE